MLLLVLPTSNFSEEHHEGLLPIVLDSHHHHHHPRYGWIREWQNCGHGLVLSGADENPPSSSSSESDVAVENGGVFQTGVCPPLSPLVLIKQSWATTVPLQPVDSQNS